MKPHRILFYDVETAPLLAHIWHPQEGYVAHDRIIHDSFLIAWAAKWSDERQVRTGVLTPRETREQDDARIVTGLADLLREADTVVAHNGDRFDVKMVNNRLIQMELEPLGPIQSIDTLKLAKANFRLASNKLDYLAKLLGFGTKIKTDFELWRRCYLGDEAALERMRRYNRKDVLLLEKVFERMRPYVKGLPRMVDGAHGEMICPDCGSDHLIKRGTHRTKASNFQKYQCRDCGRYCRSRKSEENRLGVHPL